jgi:hypothetical protein
LYYLAPYPRKVFIDGVLVFSWGDHNSKIDTGIPYSDTSEHKFEFVYSPNDYNGQSSAKYPHPFRQLSFGRGVELSLFKIEDVTDLPEADQRATPWIPHVDDPEYAGYLAQQSSPPAPVPEAATPVSTNLADSLVPRYTGETNVYDLPLEDYPEGDYEVQFSYNGAVMARGPFSVRNELPCSKLLSYNNREDDFGTIFTPGSPFTTRIEGEFLPQDDEFGVEDNDFRDQNHTLHNLSAHPTAIRKLSFGGGLGAPNFIGNKVNRIFACSEVLIDGEKYIRADGAGVTKEIWFESYPKYPFKINLEKQDSGFFKALYTFPHVDDAQ